VSGLLFNAFRALDSAADRREIATVAAALRESGDEVGRLLHYEENPELWDRCCAIADEAGAYGFVALDLAVAFHNPAAFAELVKGEAERLSTGVVD
jgi:hypothetical protein